MATLKISELSAGDWVRYKGKEYTLASIYMAAEGYPHMVALTYQGISCGCTYIDHLEHIPITAEILEKNGLYRHEIDKDNPQQVVLSNHFMMARTYDDVEWWRVLIYDEEIPSEELFNGIVYSVHQLQHAFRLAGIDKEINL